MTPDHLPVQISRRRVNGLTLEVAEAGPASGPLLIFLHGFPDLWQGWHWQLPPTIAAGFRILAPNQRGYGESDKPGEVSAYDIDFLADDVAALADTEGRSTIRVIGHDWGGVVAWWVAARFPERVDRVVILNAPHLGTFQPYLLRHPTQLLRSTYAVFFQLPWLPEAILKARDYALLFRAVQSTSLPGIFDASDRRYLVQGWSQEGALTAMLNYYRANFRRNARSLRMRIRPPTLIVCGRLDPSIEPGLAKAGAAYCDDVRIVEFHDARHWIQREEPDRFNAHLLSFLTSPVETHAAD